MGKSIKSYAKLGLVHHLLYPECTSDMEYHAATLKEFVKRGDIEALDCCLPYDDRLREELIPIIRDCGKDVSYALHLFPARKISLASTDIQEQAVTKLLLGDQIRMAAAIGATGFVFVSGADVPDNRPAAQAAFKAFCKWFCGELKPFGITALLEPFDRTIDKKYLYGPIDDCVALVDEIAAEYPNIGIELDMAHLPLMFEGFASSIERCADRIRRVHLGNCVLKDRTHPLYGDYHPPMGLPGGEVAKPELVVILESLLRQGYLSETDRKPLILEMTPFPGKDARYTVEKSMELLESAWEEVKL
ncbi:MAG TPA: TIM barrel protein [Feifaniaceae bacterium]|nr:TIM barrel protein [Feifaniaceae bacterium]